MNLKELDKKLLKIKRIKKEFEKNDLNFNVSELIIDYRIKNGLSQAQLAKKIGKKQSSVARLESGKHSPTLNYLEKISKALKIEVRDLIPTSNLKISIKNSSNSVSDTEHKIPINIDEYIEANFKQNHSQSASSKSYSIINNLSPINHND